MSLEAGGAIEPIIEVRLFDAGEADPRVTLHGYNYFDSLIDSHELAERNPNWGSSRNARGEALLEFLPEINGVTNRGFFVAQDTLLSRWDILGGSWSERKPSTGRYRSVRLDQYDSSPTLVWGLRSRLFVEQDAARVVSLSLPDTPPDYDSGTVEPFVRIEVGSGAQRLAIYLGKDGRCLLLVWVPALNDYVFARDLPAPVKGQGYSDAEECFIAWKIKRGRFGVSTDMGREWQWWGDPESVTIPSHKPIIRGAGGEITFGLHKLTEYTGLWASVPQPTLTSTFFGSAIQEPRADLPAGSVLNFTDLSDTLAGLAQYGAELVPNSYGQGPVLYWNVLRYVTQSVVGTATYTTPWTGETPTNGACHECRIEKREHLRESTCTLTIKLDPDETPLTALRRRKIAVYMGIRVYDASGDHEDRWNDAPKFTGYIGAVSIAQSEFGGNVQTIQADAAAHWTRTRWWPTDVRPFGGHYLNDALDYILNSEGIEGELNLVQYRAWDAFGATFLLDPGSPEEPFELIKAGEDKFSTMERLAGYAEMELGVDDRGKLFTLRKNPSGVPATTGISHTYTSKDSNDLEALLNSVANRLDYDRSATAVMLTGRNQVDGSAMRFYALDIEAETDTTSERFCPWREGEPEEVSEPCSADLLLYRTGERAYELLPLKWEPDVETFLAVTVGRRDTLVISGCEDQALEDAVEAIVMTESLTFQQGLDGPATLETTMGLYKLPA